MFAEPRCYWRHCRHFQGVTGDDEVDQVLSCPAFPQGIPERIAYGEDNHEVVAPDQVGDTVYEKE